MIQRWSDAADQSVFEEVHESWTLVITDVLIIKLLTLSVILGLISFL